MGGNDQHLFGPDPDYCFPWAVVYDGGSIDSRDRRCFRFHVSHVVWEVYTCWKSAINMKSESAMETLNCLVLFFTFQVCSSGNFSFDPPPVCTVSQSLGLDLSKLCENIIVFGVMLIMHYTIDQGFLFSFFFC